MHLALCSSSVDEVQAIFVGERLAWEGPVSTNGPITINKPELFGGDRKEGGIVGKVDVEFGEPTQTKNAYLQSKIGVDIPAYKGFLSLVLNQVYVCATNPYPKAWAVRVKSIQGKALNPTKAEINGSMNAANIIYEAWTNTDWGLGNPIDDLDTNSFTAASNLFYAEGMGFSFQLVNSQTAEEFILNVLGHCNAVMGISKTTGKLNLIPIREVTTPITSSFNEDNVIKVSSFERPTYSEIVNEIVVKYRPQAALKDASVTAQNLAGIQAAGTIISQQVDYPGVDNEDLANRIALRDLRQLSTPLAKLQFTVDRNGWDLTEGDVFKFSWAAYTIIDIAMRVISIDYGTLSNREIKIVAEQDIFSLPSTSYSGVQPPLWVDPIVPPINALSFVLQELSYYDIVTNLSAADLSALPADAVLVRAFVEKPPIASQNYTLYTSAQGETFTIASTGQYTPTLVSLFNIASTTTTLNFTQITQEIIDQGVGGYAYIDDEAVIIENIAGTGVITIGRGALDTCPRPHLAGSKVYFGQLLDGEDDTLYLENETVTGAAATRTGVGVQTSAIALKTTVVTVGRYQKPYPPAKFLISGNEYPEDFTGDLEITWVHRDRLTQTAGLIPTTTGSIGPEAGTTYTVTIRNASTNGLIKQVSGITGTSFTYTLQDEISDNNSFASLYNVQVSSQRDGETSYQFLQHELTRINNSGFDVNATPPTPPTFNLTIGIS